MHDIYLTAKISNMDIIILFLFINLFLCLVPPPILSSAHPTSARFVQNIVFLLYIICFFYNALKKIIIYVILSLSLSFLFLSNLLISSYRHSYGILAIVSLLTGLFLPFLIYILEFYAYV